MLIGIVFSDHIVYMIVGFIFKSRGGRLLKYGRLLE